MTFHLFSKTWRKSMWYCTSHWSGSKIDKIKNSRRDSVDFGFLGTVFNYIPSTLSSTVLACCLNAINGAHVDGFKSLLHKCGLFVVLHRKWVAYSKLYQTLEVDSTVLFQQLTSIEYHWDQQELPYLQVGDSWGFFCPCHMKAETHSFQSGCRIDVQN